MLRKAKNCPRLLEPRKVAPKAKSCRAQSEQDYHPAIQESVKFRFRDFLRQYLCSLSLNLGCVRLGKPDLDFQNLNPDFPIEREIRNGFHLREIRPQCGFQLRNPNPDFLDFLFTVRFGNPKKDLQNCPREQRSSFC